MLQLLANGATPASTVAIILAAAGGTIGAIVAMLKLKPEANQSAVLQAQGAMETMVALQEELERAKQRSDERAERAFARAERLQQQLNDLQERHDYIVDRWGPFPPLPEQRS